MSGSPRLAELHARYPEKITAAGLRAGNQFRGDWMLVSTASSRDSLDTRRGEAGDGGPEAVCFARRRVELVRSWLGVPCTRLAIGVIVDDKSAREVSLEMGQPERWGGETMPLVVREIQAAYRERDEADACAA